MSEPRCVAAIEAACVKCAIQLLVAQHLELLNSQSLGVPRESSFNATCKGNQYSPGADFCSTALKFRWVDDHWQNTPNWRQLTFVDIGKKLWKLDVQLLTRDASVVPSQNGLYNAIPYPMMIKTGY